MIKCVGTTKYLGTIISRNGKSSEDIKRRIDIASATTNQLNKCIYRAKNIKLKTKINLHKSLVHSILLYNAECWQICKADEVRLKSSQKRCLKKITKADRKVTPGEIDNVTIDELMDMTKTKPILETINERRKNFLEHVDRQIERGECSAWD